MKRAAAYARYSSDRQSDISIEAQLEEIKRFAREKGYEIVAVYTDRAQSASTDERPQFQKMVEDAKKGLFDAVIVHKVDRFSRNMYDAVVYKALLKKHNVELLSVSEAIGDDPSGELIFHITTSVADWYRKNLANEILTKTRYVAAKGYQGGGKPPFGYGLIEVRDEQGKTRKKYVINEEEANVVREIFELAARGFSLARIARILNEKGHRTRRGNVWTARSIYEILRNEKYMGVMTWCKGTKRNYHARRNDTLYVEGVIPAIVDRELWEKARKTAHVQARRSKKREYKLLGIVYCWCGSPMTAGQGGNYPRYRCAKAQRERIRGHAAVGVNKLENFVFSAIKHRFLENINFEALAESINRKFEQEAIEDSGEKMKLLEELQEIQIQIDNAVNAILKGVEVEELRDKLEKLKQRQTEIKRRLSERKRTTLVTVETLKKDWPKIEQMFREHPEELARSLIKRITIHKDHFIEIEWAI